MKFVQWRARVRQPVGETLAGYGMTLIFVGAALGADLFLERHVSGTATHPTPPFFTAVMLSAWFGGVGPGLLAVLVSIPTIEYYFGHPIHALGGASTLIIFTLSALFIAWLSGIQTETAHLLSEARDELEIRVEKRTAELKRANEALLAEIANRKQAEEALLTAQAQLAHVTRVTTLGEFAASIAHEIKQPLTAIATNANACLHWLAGESANIEEARQTAARIVRDAMRTGEVLDRIRGMLKQNALQVGRVNVNDMIHEVLELTAGEFLRSRVVLRTELAPEDLTVVGDRVQLQQVVLNLVMNGIEALEAVTDRPRELLVSTSNESHSGEILVSVRDSGTGTECKDTESLFRPFYTTKAGGMGIGLSISRSIVENHGGRLWGVINEDRGMTFQFILPSCAKDQDARAGADHLSG